MVRVAVCPKCSHESVMFDQPDSDEWARCPECRTYFQIKQAAAREIPQLVMTADEALLAEEESEAAKETVDSTLETRWETRRTLNAASTQTIPGVEPATSVSPDEGAGSDESLPPEDGQNASRRTISDLSSLATWSELPIDQIEAQVRAEQAGDTPERFPATSETPTLPLRRSRDGVEANREKKLPESTEDSDERVDKWFQTKATIFDFTPPTLDEADQGEADDGQPPSEMVVSPNFEVDDELEIESVSPSNEESSPDDGEPDSTDANDDRDQTRPASPPAWPQPRPIPIWARQRRRRSPLRTIVMIGFGGVIGLALGYYALLWITGPGGDFLNAARYLPSAVLPREFHLREVKLPASNEVTSETARALDVTAADEQPVSRETALSPDETGEKELDPDAGRQASEVIEIVGAPSFSADELAVALSKAKEAQAGLVTGNFVDGGEVKRTKAQSYMAFCDLAQKATFVDMASNASYASALERDVEELCRTTLADAHAQGELTHLVPLWIKSRKRTHAGIFLAGRIANQADKGSVVEFQLDMGSGAPLTVLVSQEQAGAVASSAWPLAVLGWIVDQPAENVHGYTGDAPQAVWAGKFIDLE